MSIKQLAIPHLITTIIYYKWTESIGMYINWGFLTDAQHELYSWAACGWVVIVCVWILILDNVNTKEKQSDNMPTEIVYDMITIKNALDRCTYEQLIDKKEYVSNQEDSFLKTSTLQEINRQLKDRK